jgi:NADH-quinone oxidoreductase subunit G
LAPVEHGLSRDATEIVRTVPGEPIGTPALDAIARATANREGPVVVVLGRPSLAESPAAVVRSAAALAQLPNVRFLSALRRANVHGALDAGLTPGFLPGRVTSDAGADWYANAWDGAPPSRGLDAEGVLWAAADGKVRVLVLLGADPIADFPDAALARRALETVGTVIAVDAFWSESNRRADIFLPCTLWGEKTGSVTNIEGRIQRLGRKVAPEGTAMDDWRIANELALRLGYDRDLATVDEVADEMARVSPAHLGVTASLLRRARDGVVLPLREHLDEVVMRTGELSILAEDGSSASWDPIKVEGAAPDADVVDAEGASADAAPSLHTWDGAAAGEETPARDSYALRLVVGHILYDGGRLVAETPALQRVRQSSGLLVSPHDATQLGVESGGEVRITSARGTQVVTVAPDPGIPAGVARYDFTADGAGVAELIDVTLPVTDLRVESVR